ncbi:MAG: hypothetical protein OIF56_12745, partial [Cohaesibacter sp.]|nr:hypothetical protein [Cohaesibacter sp.]
NGSLSCVVFLGKCPGIVRSSRRLASKPFQSILWVNLLCRWYECLALKWFCNGFAMVLNGSEVNWDLLDYHPYFGKF